MKPDSNILARIVARKLVEIGDSRPIAAREDWAGRVRDLPPPPDFFAALANGEAVRVIAEIKKASPSAGVLRPDFDPPAIARSYAQGGAACLSVLTDRDFFQGSIDDLRAVRAAVGLPLLRKDFVLDPVQVHEARLAGASAVLLIAECLDRSRMAELVGLIRSLDMEALVELYDADNLGAVLASGTRLVGVNNRNLRTFETRLERTIELIPSIPKDRIVVSESGIKTPADVRRLREAGARAILVGETFMRAADPGAKLRDLLDEA